MASKKGRTMSGHLRICRLVAVLALVAVAGLALSAEGISGVPFTLGSSIADVQKALGLSVRPEPLPVYGKEPNSSALRSRDKGISAFFHDDERIYLIRLDPPFAGSVGGMKLGEPRLALLQKLGTPKRMSKHPGRPWETYMYEIAPGVGASFDFDKAETINTIMLFPTLKGSSGAGDRAQRR